MIAIGHRWTPKTWSNVTPRAASIQTRNWSGPVLSLFPIRVVDCSRQARTGRAEKGWGGKHTNIPCASLTSTVDDKDCRPGPQWKQEGSGDKLGPVELRWFTNKFISSGLRHENEHSSNIDALWRSNLNYMIMWPDLMRINNGGKYTFWFYRE